MSIGYVNRCVDRACQCCRHSLTSSPVEMVCTESMRFVGLITHRERKREEEMRKEGVFVSRERVAMRCYAVV